MTAVRFAALGDSLTEGVGDPVPGGWRGWAALLADGLAATPADTGLLNCARSGAQSADVAAEQLATALAFRPHLAAVVVGGNDTLRSTFDVAAVAERLNTVFGQLTAGGAVLLTACLPDPGRVLRLPWPLARPLGRRMRAVNHVVHVLSDRHRAVHLHAADLPWAADRAVWSVDRLHPGEIGHRLLARDFHALLAARGLAHGAAPSAAPDCRPPGALARARWTATQGTGWVKDRCTDLLPDLLRLAAREYRHRAPGAAAALEERALRQAHRAVADLPQPRPGTNRTGVPGTACAAAASADSGTTPITG
jgi:lysophospholipase L1-like esterase